MLNEEKKEANYSRRQRNFHLCFLCRAIFGDVIVRIFSDQHKTLRREGIMLDTN